MGCDIHVYLEKRLFSYNDEKRKNGVWINADKWQRDTNYDLYKVTDPESVLDEYGGTPTIIKGWEIPYEDRIYNGRNYDLFAILANVRNGRGFAGIETGEGFNPIAIPKGVPDDCSDVTRACLGSYGTDGHSHSWFTLKELLDFDWEGQSTVFFGAVDEKDYKTFKENGIPNSWFGVMAGTPWNNNIIMISNEEMEKLISGEKDREVYTDIEGNDQPIRYITKIKWGKTYAQSCQSFIDNTIPKLKLMVREFNTEENKRQSPMDQVQTAEDIRICFFFDN